LQVLDTRFSDIGHLEQIQVKHLQLGSLSKTHYVNIGDGSTFPAFPGLARLDLTTRSLTSLTPLAHLTGVRALYAGRNKKLRSLEGVEALPLEVLGLAMTSVADLSPLAGKPIKHIDLASTRVEDLSPLMACAALCSVMLDSCPAADDAAQVARVQEHVERNGGTVYTGWDAPYVTDLLDQVLTHYPNP
jgi:Leucine-rich repeat (LRR) protein